ncbi:MAG: SRPBCC family protein [Myxococcales bacterium]|nr:SRPBCC family protein [Myxococcales bacterium]
MSTYPSRPSLCILGVAAALASGCATTLHASDEGGGTRLGSLAADEGASHVVDPAVFDEPVSERIPIPGSDFVRGRARVVVRAPIERVRATLYDFKSYPEFMPYWDTARVVGKKPDGAHEVYMSVKLLYGALRLWARLDFPKPTLVDGVEVIEERYVEGNLKELQGRWQLRAIDADRCEVTVEVLMLPKMPLPLELVNNCQEDGARMLVDAVRLRAEGRDDG